MEDPLIPSALPFDQAWLLDDAQRYFDVVQTFHQLPDGELPAYRKNTLEPAQERMARAAYQHLAHVAQTEGLPLPDHAEHVGIPWLDAWRELAEHGTVQEVWTMRALGSLLQQALCSDASMRRPDVPKGGDRNAPYVVPVVYAYLQEKMREGSFRAFELSFNRTCATSGTPLRLSLNRWKPLLETYESVPGKLAMLYTPLAAGQIQPPQTHHLVLPVPTGQLWINDWFRHADITAKSKALGQDTKGIDSDAGRVEETLAHAQALGMAHVFVGGSNPSVVLKGSRLLIGEVADPDYHDEGPFFDPAGDGNVLGRVCTDLRWVTIIDRQVLVDRLSEGRTVEEAEAAVQDLAKELRHTLIQVTVPPGAYHLHFSGSPKTFQERFACADEPFKGFKRPMFVLSQDELVLDEPFKLNRPRSNPRR